jgi:VCBS repeat-containing protein
LLRWRKHRRQPLANKAGAGKAALGCTPPFARRHFLLEPLEPRLLLSADSILSEVYRSLLDDAAQGPGRDFAAIVQELDAATRAETPAVAVAWSDGWKPAANALIVADASLAKNLRAGGDVLVLDGNRDGLEQITQALAGRSGVTELHMLAHGASGRLQLGSTTLDASSLEQHTAQLFAWAPALSADADILLYACDLAAGTEGLGFVQQFALLTGADVAASTDLSGSAELGGDWDLEQATGAIEARVLSINVLTEPCVLATVTYDAALDQLTFTADAGDTDSVQVVSPAADRLRILVSSTDLISFTPAAGFTATALNQLDIDTSIAPVAAFDISLGDQDDSLTLTNNLANNLGRVTVDGGDGSDRVTLNQSTLAGDLTLAVETVGIAGSVSVGGGAIKTAGAALTLSGTPTITAATLSAQSISLGNANAALNAQATIGTLTMAGTGTLSGSGTVVMTGSDSSWASGTYTGTGQLRVDTGAMLTISGIGIKRFGTGTLANDGTLLWSGGSIDVIGSGSVLNRGVFDIQGSGTFGDQGTGVGTLTFSNAAGALLTKSGSGGLTALGSSGGGTPNGMHFSNAGTVEVHAGSLSINHSFAGVVNGTGTSSGAFNVMSGASLLFGGQHTLTASSVVAGAGAVSVEHGDFRALGVWTSSGALSVEGGIANFTPTGIMTPAQLTVSGGSGTFGAAVNTGALTVSGGTAGFNAPANTTGLLLSSGILNASGTGLITLQGTSSWTGGILGTAHVQVRPGVALTIGSDALKRFGNATLANDGTVVWSGGHIEVIGNGSVVNRGVFDVQGTGTFGDQGTGSGSLTFFNQAGALLTKSAGIGLTAIGSSGGNTPNPVNFSNAGAVEVHAGTLSINHHFANPLPNGIGTSSGTFSVDGGAALLFGGTNTLTGTSLVSGVGAVSAKHGVFSTTGTWSNTGALSVDGGTATFAPIGGMAPASVTIASAATFNTALATGPLTVTAGTASFNAQAATTALNFAGGTLTGTGVVTLLAGTHAWTGGLLSGSGALKVAQDATLSINASGDRFIDGKPLENDGRIRWTGTGDIDINGTVTFANRGVFELPGAGNRIGGSVFAPTGTLTLTNTGTVLQHEVTGSTTFYLGSSVDNAGLIDIRSGRVDFEGNSTHTGDVRAATGTIIGFRRGEHQFVDGSSLVADQLAVSGGSVSVSGLGSEAILSGLLTVAGGAVNLAPALGQINPGTITVSGGTLDLTPPNAPFALTQLTISGGGTANLHRASHISNLSVSGFHQSSSGGLGGSGEVTLLAGGVHSWASGALSGSGALKVAPNATLNINSFADRFINGKPIENDGRIAWTGSGDIDANFAVTFTNRGVFELPGAGNEIGNRFSGPLPGTIAVINIGTILQQAAGATNFIAGSTVDNRPGGLIDVQTGAVNVQGTLAQAGRIAVASSATFQKTGGLTNFGTLSGTGTFAVGAGNDLINRGTVAAGASPGGLTVSGDLILTADSVLDFELAGLTRGTEHDALAVTGATVLAGTANILHIDGFVPRVGNSFQVISAGGVTGGFAAVHAPTDVTYQTIQTPSTVNFQTTTVTNRWATDASGDWSDPTNWTLGVTPRADQVVIIDRGSANPTVSVSTPGEIAGALSAFEAVAVSAGSLELVGDARFNGGLALSGGTLKGAGGIAVNGSFDWSGGSVGAGAPLITGGATNITGSATLSGRGWNNLGTVNLSLASATAISSTGSFNNAGTFINAGSTPHTALFASFTSSGQLIIAGGALVLAAGEVDFNGGPDSVSGIGRISLEPDADTTPIIVGGSADSPLVFDITDNDLAALASSLQHLTIGRSSGTHAITVDASGAVLKLATDLRAQGLGGSITVSGPLRSGLSEVALTASEVSLGEGAALHVELAGTGSGQFTRYTISDHVILDGALNVQLVNGFAPASGNRFEFMTYASRSGEFTEADLPAEFVLDYDAQAAALVFAPNDAPIAEGDAYATAEDTPLSVVSPGVLDNDIDDGNPDGLSAELVSEPAHGTLTLNADGSFTYTPNADFNGSDSFTYRASDGELTDEAVVHITVTAVNDAPTAGDDAYSTAEDTALTVAAPGVLGNDSDIDSSLAAVLVSGPAHGTLGLNADGSFTYTPNADFNGSDSFTYRAGDGELTDDAVVHLAVTAVNDAPAAAADAYSTDEGTSLVVAAPGVLANDTDVDSTTLTAVLVSGPAHGTLVLNSDGSFTYTPAAGFNGTDGFTYRASDGEAETGAATVTLTVRSANDAPAVDGGEDQLVGLQKKQLGYATITLEGLFTDADVADTHLATIDWGDGSDASAGTVDEASGSITGEHSYTEVGIYTVTVTVRDSAGAERADTLTITVVDPAKNQVIRARADRYQVAEGGTLQVSAPQGVLSNDSAAAGATLQARLVSGPQHGTLAFNADGSFSYTADADFTGRDFFWYELNDGTSVSKAVKVWLVVAPVGVAQFDWTAYVACGKARAPSHWQITWTQSLADWLAHLTSAET